MIEIEHRDGIHVLHMRSGENRFNRAFLDALNGALDTVEKAAEPTALVTTGEGKFYSNGLDLDWLVAEGASGAEAFLADFERLFARVLTFPTITVAALNGHVFAGGAMFSLAHDFRLMRTERGFWCLPEVDLGMPLRPGMNAVIEAKLPRRAYHESIVTGRRYAAEEAHSEGIVDGAVDESTLLERAVELAVRHAGKNRDALVALKRGMYERTLAVLEAHASHQR
jgi:enoyl-CoA hydratase/carnithine racemase